MARAVETALPRRILALSGGGVRGIVEVAFLEAAETVYKRRFGPETQLCDIFHLIGGTSTGALIATALSLGLPLSRIKAFYLEQASEFFERRRWLGGIRPGGVFDSDALEREFRGTVGDILLGDPAFRTYLAIVTKRLDTGSPWIVNNIPTAPYFEDAPDGSYLGNRQYPVAQLLRAATAAPTFFEQQSLQIGPGQRATFVDGGLSPHNDPSLALLKLARLSAFGLNWPVGEEQLFVLSVGAGRFRQRIKPALAEKAWPLQLAYLAMRGMVGDAEEHTLAMMQWLGKSRRPICVNSEIGSLADDHLTPDPIFSFLRLDLPLEEAELKSAGLDVPAGDLRRFRRFDDPGIIRPIYDLTRAYIDATLDLDTLLMDPPIR